MAFKVSAIFKGLIVQILLTTYKSLKMTELQVKRVGDTILFWLEPANQDFIVEGKTKVSKGKKQD